jgi:hypothetical protein
LLRPAHRDWLLPLIGVSVKQMRQSAR